MIGQIVSLNISEATGTIKTPREQIEVNQIGFLGDAHAGQWHRQVSMLAQEDIDLFSAEHVSGRRFVPGEFAENITTFGIDLKKVAVLDRFRMGDVELEVTQIGKKCHGTGCAIFVEVGNCVMPKAGIFLRVVNTGLLRTGDRIECRARTLKIKIITLSDRASSGTYKDLSGPAIKNILVEFFADKRWHMEYTYSLIPDDEEILLAELQNAVTENVDVVFTTGGTGIGPRDITPDVIEQFADKLIPGIMESIRLTYGQTIPTALLSRSVAAVKDQTLIYCLPGSVKASTEYTTEILRTLEHSLMMLHGIGH